LAKGNTAIAETDDAHIQKVKAATAGLPPELERLLLKRVSKENAGDIVAFIFAMRTEFDISDNYRRNLIRTLAYLSECKEQKLFRQMTRDDVLSYLETARKTKEADPLDRWYTTWNLRAIEITKFFKWLYYPKVAPKERKKPKQVQNLPRLQRKQKNSYKPTDMWDQSDDLLFLKHCPEKRDRCYHTMSRDTSCRPHELLKLKIKDIVWKNVGGIQYAEAMVHGKTGARSIPLFAAVPYLKDWIDSHPYGKNPNAYLFPSLSTNHRGIGNNLKPGSLSTLYWKYKNKYFPTLLENPTVSPEDKQKIRDLLQKPWNPYIRRHSALTEKAGLPQVNENILRQHAGWSVNSKMPSTYFHFYGNESNKSMLKAWGVLPKDGEAENKMTPVMCPNCKEPNQIDAKFCLKCRMVLSYDAYKEAVALSETDKDQLSKDVEKMVEVKVREILGKVDFNRLRNP
jgi:integrase